MTFGSFSLLLRHSIWRHVSYDVRVGHIKYFNSVCTHERTNHHSLCLTNSLMCFEWCFFTLLLMTSYLFYAWPASTNLEYVHVSIDILRWFRVRIHILYSPIRIALCTPDVWILWTSCIDTHSCFGRSSFPSDKRFSDCGIESVLVHGLSKVSNLNFSRLKVGLRIEIKDTLIYIYIYI